jgi:hypothetical protein
MTASSSSSLLVRARGLAESFSRRDALPIAPSQDETRTMADAILLLTRMVFREQMNAPLVGSDDPIDGTHSATVVPVGTVPVNNIFALLTQPELAHLGQLPTLLDTDMQSLFKAAKNYGDSWKRRGGVGAYMMLARKWDRLDKRVFFEEYDVFRAVQHDTRREGAIDDIRDLRRYLALVECECLERGLVEREILTKDDPTTIVPQER